MLAWGSGTQKSFAQLVSLKQGWLELLRKRLDKTVVKSKLCFSRYTDCFFEELGMASTTEDIFQNAF